MYIPYTYRRFTNQSNLTEGGFHLWFANDTSLPWTPIVAWVSYRWDSTRGERAETLNNPSGQKWASRVPWVVRGETRPLWGPGSKFRLLFCYEIRGKSKRRAGINTRDGSYVLYKQTTKKQASEHAQQTNPTTSKEWPPIWLDPSDLFPTINETQRLRKSGSVSRAKSLSRYE